MQYVCTRCEGEGTCSILKPHGDRLPSCYEIDAEGRFVEKSKWLEYPTRTIPPIQKEDHKKHEYIYCE